MLHILMMPGKYTNRRLLNQRKTFLQEVKFLADAADFNDAAETH